MDRVLTVRDAGPGPCKLLHLDSWSSNAIPAAIYGACVAEQHMYYRQKKSLLQNIKMHYVQCIVQETFDSNWQQLHHLDPEMHSQLACAAKQFIYGQFGSSEEANYVCMHHL